MFALSPAGAALLVEAKRAKDIDELDWAKKNKDAGRVFIRHTLAEADFSTCLARAARLYPDHKILQHDALIATLPDDTRARLKPWSWGPVTLPPAYAVSGNAATFSIVPDCPFRVDLPDQTRRAFLVEIDRATMPVYRKNLYQTSLYKKWLGYHFGHRLKLHKTLFGWAGVRFLIVTTTPARVATALKIIKAMPDLYRDDHGEHFWFTDMASLIAAPDILTHPWQCADGKTKTILSASPVSTTSAVRHRSRQV